MRAVTFKDRVLVHVYAGNGGNGCCSFRREKFIPKGGPDGGDGGRGGSVYLCASKDTGSLLDLYFQPHQRAGHGGHGGGKQCTGRNGRDLRVPVPCGTEVRLKETGERLGEVIRTGDELVVARGGAGGLGNMHFATPSHRAPTRCTPGGKGEQNTLVLEMKSVAEVGLVGYPNAGKSTLLRALTPARPRVAAYPFTTLHPVIGTVTYDDFTRLRIADIPGLMDGAHAGIGLGHDFLRHIERTSFLLFVVDLAGVDGRDPADDYAGLRKELELYGKDLAARPFLVVANKMDLPAARERYAEFVRRTHKRAMRISAETGEGIEALKKTLRQKVITGGGESS
jgi:GTP-binding protein